MNARIGIVAALPLLAGCGFALGAGVDVIHEDVYYEDAYYGHGGGVYVDSYAVRFDTRRLPVARGHLPRPGRCRIWLPGVAPGHQARSGSCRALQRRVPRGAWLLVRPRGRPDIVELVAHDSPRIGVHVRYVYDVRTGRRLNLN